MITEVQKVQILQLTQATFNAAPGASLMNNFALFIENGGTIQQLADSFVSTDVFKLPELYPAYLTAREFGVKLMNNLVGNTASVENKNIIVDAIETNINAGMSQSQIITILVNALSECPVSDPNWGAAAQQFNNKVDVSYYYSITKGISGQTLSDLQNVTVNVTNDVQTVAQGKYNVDHLQDGNHVFEITSGNVLLTGSVNSGTDKVGTQNFLHNGIDQINVTNTLTNSSVIQDTTYGDNDVLNITNNTGIVNSIIANVETINLTSFNQGINLLSSTGYDTINLLGSGTIDIQNLISGKMVTVTTSSITDIGISSSSTTATETLKLNGGVTVNYDDDGINGIGNKIDTTIINSIGTSANNVTLTNIIGSALNLTGTTNLTVKVTDGQIDGSTVNASSLNGISTINVTNDTNGIDLSKVSGIDNFNFTNISGLTGNDDVFTISNGANITITPSAVTTTNGNLMFIGDTLAVSGINDSVTLNLNGTTVGVGTIDTTVFETVNINSNGSGSTTIGTVTLATTPITETVKFNGNTDLTVGIITADVISAAGMTAKFTMTGNSTAVAGSIVYGGSGNNVLFGSVNSDIIYGGVGNDTINSGVGQDQILIGQGGSDTIRNTTGYIDNITGFTSNDVFDINYSLVSNNGTALDLAGFGTTKSVESTNVLNIDNLSIGLSTGYNAATNGIITIKSNIGTLTNLTETDFRSKFGVGGTEGALTVGTNDQGKFIVVAYDGTTLTANGAAFLVYYNTSVDGSKVIESGDTVTLIGTFSNVGADTLTYINFM